MEDELLSREARIAKHQTIIDVLSKLEPVLAYCDNVVICDLLNSENSVSHFHVVYRMLQDLHKEVCHG